MHCLHQIIVVVIVGITPISVGFALKLQRKTIQSETQRVKATNEGRAELWWMLTETDSDLPDRLTLLGELRQELLDGVLVHLTHQLTALCLSDFGEKRDKRMDGSRHQ